MAEAVRQEDCGMDVAEEGVGKATDNITMYSVLCGIELIDSVSALAKLPGEIADDREIERKLVRFADRFN